MYSCTSDIATLTKAFEDPIEHAEAVNQLIDAGWMYDELSIDGLRTPHVLASHIVRCFGSYDVRVA